jgi:hypothetical protein
MSGLDVNALLDGRRLTMSDDDRTVEEIMCDERLTLAKKEVKQLKEQAHQLRRDISARLRLTSQMAPERLMEESDQLGAAVRALDLEVAAKDAWIAIQGVELDLHRLRRNDPNEELVDYVHYKIPFGYGQGMGEALLGNTMVKELYLNLGLLLPHERYNTAPDDFIEPLLRFVAESAALDYLYLFEYESDRTLLEPVSPELVVMFLNAMARNPRIESLWMNLRKPWLTFPHLATAGTHLKTLRVYFVDFYHCNMTTVEENIIGWCIASLPALEHLDLTVEGLNESLAPCILEHLTRAKSSLRHLEVQVHFGDESYFAAISQFLRSTTKLEHLQFTMQELGVSDVQHLLNGLLHVDKASGVSFVHVSKLAFSNCLFDDPAFELFASFLQTKTMNDNGAVVCHSSLRELSFENFSHNRLGECVSGQLANSLKMMPPRTETADDHSMLIPTIGSLVQSVALVRVHPIFMRNLGINADRVRLNKLRLVQVSKAACRALGYCLPRLTSLQTLMVEKVNADGALWILHGLKRNGSIGHLDPNGYAGGSCNFDAVQLRMAEAYCQRNSCLAEVMERILEPSENEDDDVPDLSEVGIVPTLMHVAKQSPRTGAAAIMRGLLRLGRKCDSATAKSRVT